MEKLVPYGIMNYAELVRKQCYWVDKTRYIPPLEQIQNPVFLRPKRFGKSLWCSILEHYYDLKWADNFDELFGHTWIGRHPTATHNQYIVLSLDFSPVEVGHSLEAIEKSFKNQHNVMLDLLRFKYAELLGDMPKLGEQDAVADNLRKLLQIIGMKGLPPVYVIIDEYDNFANHLITTHQDHLYEQLMADDSFLKAFFKVLKDGRKDGTIANVFITGVLPMMIDELASGFNVASVITLNPRFEYMLGFTQSEVDALLDEVYADYTMNPATRSEVDTIIKTQYDGYHFLSPDSEDLYNSTTLMFFLSHFCQHRTIPKALVDYNLRTDLSWVRRITGSLPSQTNEFVEQLTFHNRIGYDEDLLTSQFNRSQFFQPNFFPISFFYLGMLTKENEFFLKLPNVNMRKMFVEYFNQLHHIDVSTRYSEVMQRFARQPDLPQLFADYWRLYVSQLPEAIFQQMNENFYRTTFMELCGRYLSKWFTWNVERSYPQGRTDLEFVGKYHEQFAGLRYVIEFKYYSNTEFKTFKTPLEAFQLQEEDLNQIAGYVEGLRQEYPEARVSQFVIYCVGNQGFRVFTIDN